MLEISNINSDAKSKTSIKSSNKNDSVLTTTDIELISKEEIEEAYTCSKVDDSSEVMKVPRVEDILSSSSEDEREEKVSKKKKRLAINELNGCSNKIKEIESILSSHPVSLEILRELAISRGGLIKDSLRRRAWPILMQVEGIEYPMKPSADSIKSHKDYNQVVMDVNRSLKRFPPGIDEEYRYILMDQLTILIIRILEKHPHLHYYQGYHDVAITFLLVMGEDLGFVLVERLSLTHLQEFMRPTMERTTYYLTYLYPILKRANKDLYNFLIKSGVGTLFCLPWLITWYAHTLSDYRNVVRLYDFFLATPCLMPMYIAVAIVLHRERDILSEECDMAMQYFVLSQVPDSLPFEDILKKASELYSLYPPDELQEEVELMVKQRALLEEEERKKAVMRKKLYYNNKVPRKSSGVVGMLTYLSDKLPLSNRQRHYVKIFLFAATATLATGFYAYYTNSPYLKPYLLGS